MEQTYNDKGFYFLHQPSIKTKNEVLIVIIVIYPGTVRMACLQTPTQAPTLVLCDVQVIWRYATICPVICDIVTRERTGLPYHTHDSQAQIKTEQVKE